MSRKNIFEIMNSGDLDLKLELKRIIRLFESEKTVRVSSYPSYDFYTVYEYADKYGFSSWKSRGRCIDVEDFLSQFDYNLLCYIAENNMQKFLTLIEIVYNFWHIADQGTNSSNCYDERSRNFLLLKQIMDDCLAHFNYKAEYFPEREQLIVIEDKPEVTAVAEIVEEEIAYKVLRYNHYMMKGDLQGKKEILIAIGADLEPKRSDIKAVDKTLEDGIFYILNNLDLRHNNKVVGDKNYKQAVVDMDDATLENWYDELYQMMLLAYLQLDQVERKDRVENLKQLVTPRQAK